nr:PREDICTED: synaptotagmin-14-like [Rhinolophus sinicus]
MATDKISHERKIGSKARQNLTPRLQSFLEGIQKDLLYECVPPEAIGFLSAVGVFMVLLAVLFLFINKKLCFENLGGLPCLEQRGKRKHSKDKTGIPKGLAEKF